MAPCACKESLIIHTFLQVLFESHPVYDQTQGSGAVFLTLWDNSFVGLGVLAKPRV
jgi:hypothetical protein